MKKKSFIADLVRSIYKSKARFISILAIITLGVGFFAGINAAEPDMILSADKYYKANNLSDFKIVSPLGFKPSDINSVKEVKGVEKVQEGYSKDLFITSKEGNTSTVKLFSYDKKEYGDNEGLNRPVIIEGRLPESSGEIVVENGYNVPNEIKLGSMVTISLPNGEKLEDFLKTDTYTVVGIIDSPLYIDFERGQTNIGDGAIRYFAYISKEDFNMKEVSDLFISTSDSKRLTAYSKEYSSHIVPIENSFKAIGTEAMHRETKKLKDELNKGKEELNTNKEKAYKELKDGEQKLQSSEKEITEGEKELEDNEVKGNKELMDKKNQLTKAREELDKGKAQYLEKGKLLDNAKVQLDALQKSIEGLKSIRQTLSTIVPSMTEERFNKLIADIRVFSFELASSIENNFKYDDANLYEKLSTAMDRTITQLEVTHAAAKKDYDLGLAQYKASAVLLSENEKKIVDGNAALIEGEKHLKSSLENGRQRLADARIELDKGRLTYEKEKADALAKIKEAEDKIATSEKQLLDIPDKWFVTNRDGNPGYSGYGDDAKRIGAVAKVFPLFFFLVAALVCLTTMTRMIEEERVQIGTLKALGYSTLTISSKYLIYALLASLSGAMLGLSIGFKLFPTVIMNAYSMMYKIPERLTPFHANYALISILFAVFTTVSASLLAALNELRAVPAILMQPKAPKPGKRILLERIKPLWRKLSFSYKVTARNIFRYKRRFLMTIIGIAGCTALLVTGFGLRDSINAIMGKQFKEIFTYNGQLFLDTKKDEVSKDFNKILGSQKEIKAYTKTSNESVNVTNADSGRSYKANLMIPYDTNAFKSFFKLHDRKTKKNIELTSEGAVITEKLSQLLKVRVGDTIYYRDSDNRTYELKVSAIAENYLSHYIYLSPEYFEKVTHRAPVYNFAVFNVNNVNTIDEKVFKEELLNHEGVLGVMFTNTLVNKFNDTIKSLDYVVLILIISAGALAFVVLYNLTNINITERIREIATIKVLGFRDKEVSAYVYRENIILTVIGTLCGLLLGFILHRYVMDTMEIDTMMFGKEIHLISYLLSVVLTMAFSVLVNFFMYYKLRDVNMVESLKSID